mgnify:CR=1 FL=1
MTNKELGEFLKKLRLRNDLTTRQVYEKSGVSNSYLSLVENGNRKASAIILKKLANVYNVDYLDLYEKAGYIDLIEDDKKNKIDSKPKGVRVPVLGYIKAGIPISAIEEIVDYEEIPETLARKGQFFALTVKGDSMSPDIKEGDIAILLVQSNIENGEIGAIIFNGDNEATLKRIYKDETGITLIPDNPNNKDNFKPTHYTNKEIEEIPITIAGKLMEVRKKYY